MNRLPAARRGRYKQRTFLWIEIWFSKKGQVEVYSEEKCTEA
jgi:hypothetical protein